MYNIDTESFQRLHLFYQHLFQYIVGMVFWRRNPKCLDLCKEHGKPGKTPWFLCQTTQKQKPGKMPWFLCKTTPKHREFCLHQQFHPQIYRNLHAGDNWHVFNFACWLLACVAAHWSCFHTVLLLICADIKWIVSHWTCMKTVMKNSKIALKSPGVSLAWLCANPSIITTDFIAQPALVLFTSKGTSK